MANIENKHGIDIGFLYLKPRGNRTGVFTSATIPKGAVVLKMQGDLLKKPDRYSIQIDSRLHLGKGGLIDDEMNHACDANAKIDFSDLTIRAKRRIKAGEEVCINYCSTEDVLAVPFNCDCGSKQCYGKVRGYRFLPRDAKLSLASDISPYLKKRYNNLFSTKASTDRMEGKNFK